MSKSEGNNPKANSYQLNENVHFDLDGFFNVNILPQGILLTVHPPKGKGKKVNIDDVIAQINALEITDINLNLVKIEVEESSGKPVVIGKRDVEKKVPPKCIVKIPKDEMNAYLTIISPTSGAESVKLMDVKEELAKKSVIFGINDRIIREAIEKKDLDRAILVAQGRMPVNGINARIEGKFKKRTQIQFKEDEFGKVDFHELGLIQNVTPGQVLAVKTPPTEGTPGRTVTGKEIKAKRGLDVHIPAGKNTELSSDELILTSKVAGHVNWIEGRIEVEHLYTVTKDVDFKTGNIDYVGTVIISGSVKGGFKVKASGDIQVGGSVESAYIEAGGNVLIKNGVIGRGAARVKAGKNIITKFAESCTLEANEDIIVSGSILHSNIRAAKRVIATDREGTILGGRVLAGRGVYAKKIGSWSEVKTSIEVGVAPNIRTEVMSLAEQVDQDKERLKKLQLEVATLLKQKTRLGQDFSPERMQLLSSHLKEQGQLVTRLRGAPEKLSSIKKQFFQKTFGKICASEVVYPGVKICISSAILFVKEPYKYVTFIAEEGEIVIRSYEDPTKFSKEGI